MNRRNFFKFAGVGSAALLVPSTVSYFLPPSMGWGAQRLKIRVVQQYCINNDSMHFRYDATWVRPNEEHVQFHYDPLPYRDDKAARDALERIMLLEGGSPNSDHFKLLLPNHVYGAYI